MCIHTSWKALWMVLGLSWSSCGLLMFLGPYLIQKCWNHFICPSPQCSGNFPCAILLRRNAGVKGSCQSRNVRSRSLRMRSFFMVWKQEKWPKSRREKKPSGGLFPFKHFMGKNTERRITAQCTAVSDMKSSSRLDLWPENRLEQPRMSE